MPTYEHFKSLKAHTILPKHDKVGARLTCTFWQIDEYRDEAAVARLARCVPPQLKPDALLVSGSSACNEWVEAPNKGLEAAAYAERGEEDKETRKRQARQAARKRAARRPAAC